MTDWRKHIEHISVSQIRTHDRNPRRWALEKLVKLPTMDSPYTQLGSEIHDAIEGWLNMALLNKKCERRILQEPASVVNKCTADFFAHIDVEFTRYFYVPELAITLQLAKDIPPFRGYIDVLVEDYHRGCPLIMDHKTSRTRRYFLSARDLKFDLQMLVYAKYVIEKYQCPGVFLQHNQIAYSLKRRKTTIRRTYVTAERINRAMDKLADDIRAGLLKTIGRYAEVGHAGLCTSQCGMCAKAFGPGSCEYQPICQGRVTVEQYKKAHKDLTNKPGSWYIKDMIEVLNKLPPFEAIDLSGGHDGADMLKLAELMQKARAKFGHITNVWDRREAMTTALLNKIKEVDPDIVVLPAHFMGGTYDPDYLPIITNLVENGYHVVVELANGEK